jgi:hypothetical protein
MRAHRLLPARFCSRSDRPTNGPSALGQRWQRSALGGIAVAGVIGDAAWKIPMGLPGHRALGWLTILVVARLVGGRGWAAIVGSVSAALVLALGISPDGVWGVAQYAIAGVLLDVALTVRPSLGSNAIKLGLLGAIVLLTVGWIAPLGQSLGAGVPLAYLWPSLVQVAGGGVSRLVVLDLVFGASAGVLGWMLAVALRNVGRDRIGELSGLSLAVRNPAR